MNTPLPPGMTADQLVDLHECAAEWITRRQGPDWTPHDEQALAAWLDMRPLHREVFARLGHTQQLLAQLPTHRARAAATATNSTAAPASRATHGPAKSPFWQSLVRNPAFVPAMAMLACVLLGSGWLAWEHTPRYRLDLVTGPHETRNVDLPDGSQMAVNIGSHVVVRYYPRRREVVLAEGEAFFQVASHRGHPFTVDSGKSRVTVVGTAFNVRATSPRLVVKVLEGQVEVQPDRNAHPEARLRLAAHTGVAVEVATGRHQAVPAPTETVGDWRSGHLRLQRMPLGEVAQELARYLGQPVALASPSLEPLPVSGFLATAAPEGFLELLPDLVPVRVQRSGKGWIIMAR